MSVRASGLFVVCVVFFDILFAEPKFNYYWRDYVGEIPEDAVPAGLDRTNRRTYVGNVIITHFGSFPTRIYPDEKNLSLTASYGTSVYSSDVFIKILCGPHKENFVWLPATAEKLHIETIGRHLVPGGTEEGYLINIGRGQYQGELIVGKVRSYRTGAAKMYFPYKDREINLLSYEVLTYENNVIDSNTGCS